MELRSIMYIGPKTRKDDRVNGDLGRVWPGTGTIVPEVPSTQAAKLVSHKDEFIDVTGIDDEGLAELAQKAIADCSENKRQARAIGRAKSEHSAGLLLEHASEEELEAQLETLRGGRSLRETVVVVPETTGAEENLATITEKEQQDQTLLREKITQGIDAVLSKGDPELLNEEGFPSKVALDEAVGFTLTEEDYTGALESV